MHELKAFMEDAKMVENTLMTWIKEEVSKGRYGDCCCDVEALGEVVDMVKDFAEAKEKCVKAKYYECLIEQLHEEKESDRMGYDNWRYTSSGRYAPKGQGTREGYRPNMMMHEAEDIAKHRLGQNPRMGYPVDAGWPHDTTAYDQYLEAKRYYTETGNDAYKYEMDNRIKESVDDTIESFQEMWKDASPDVKKDMKASLKTLVEKMDHTP